MASTADRRGFALKQVSRSSTGGRGSIEREEAIPALEDSLEGATRDTESGATAVQDADVAVGRARRRRLERLLEPYFSRRGRSRQATTVVIPEGASSTAVKVRDAAYRRCLAIADVVSTLLALTMGVTLAGPDRLRPTILVVAPVVVVLGKAAGLYDRDEHLVRKTTLDEVPRLTSMAGVYLLLIWIGEGWFVDGSLGRGQVVALWGLLVGLMLVGRATARHMAKATTPVERCMVIGSRSNAARLKQKLDRTPSAKGDIVGFVPLEEEDDSEPQEVACLGTLATLGVVLMQEDIHRVIIAPAKGDSDGLLDTIRLVKALGVKVSVRPRFFDVVGSSVEFDDLGGLTLLGLRRHGLTRSSEFLKRAMDLSGSGIALVALAPLILIITLSIKLTSPGPTLFRQVRMGRNDTTFEMLKFRTMVDGADSRKGELLHSNERDGLFKMSDDPRVTSVGRFLRRTSLDELPQLFNVLRGDMSLVGPRPLVTDEDERVEGLDRRRLVVRPGVTGPWQILGSASTPLEEMVKIDYLYAANWSLWLDLKILLRTLGFVMARRGL